MRGRLPAVVSVFAALTWCLVASMVFVLLDGVRVAAMGDFLEDRVHLTCRNVMANYQRELYQNYGILGIDEAYSQFEDGSEDVLESMVERELDYEKELERNNRAVHSMILARVNLLDYPCVEITDGTYQVLSDGGGEVFLRQAAAYMMALFPEELTEKILGEYSDHSLFQEENDIGEIYSGAMSALQSASQLLEQSEESDESINALEDNAMTEVERRRNSPVLDLVVPNQKISTAYLNTEYCPSKRTLKVGTMPAASITMQEKLLGICYVNRMFTNYLSDKQTLGEGMSEETSSETELRYQMEYLIAGKDSDRENLSVVCSKLLVIREAVQFSRYYADGNQQAKAYAHAMALVGFTGNPALIKAVQLGFLAAWSFEDAQKDVQKLLSGEKISLLGTAGSPQYGYQDYLKLLLFAEPTRQMAMRSLDVIETHINLKLEEGSFQVDHTITAIQGSAKAKLPWLFANLIMVPVESWSICEKSVEWSEDYY